MITKETMKPLLEKLEEHEREGRRLRDAIYALRALCKHDWVITGRDSHYDHAECRICGEEDFKA